MAIPRRRVLALLAMTASGLVAACGRSAAPGEAPVSTVTPAIGPEPLLEVGAILSQSGRFSREGAALRRGIELWSTVANGSGGVRVGGTARRVRLHLRDDESEPLAGVRATDRLVREQGVGLMVGPHAGALTTATAIAGERHGALLVAPDCSEPQLYSRGLQGLVSVLPTDDRFAVSLADLSARLDPRPRPCAMLAATGAFFDAAVDGFARKAQESGLGDVAVERFAPGSSDLAPALDRLAGRRPRSVLLLVERDDLKLAYQACAELRFSAQLRVLAARPGGELVAGDGLPAGAEGVASLAWWAPEPAAEPAFPQAGGTFSNAYREQYGVWPTARAAASAAAGLVLQLGVEAAGSDDPGAVRAAIGSLDVTTFWGRMAWDQAGRNVAGTSTVLQVQRGALVPVYPGDTRNGRLRYPVTEWPLLGIRS
ncbi:MAG: ABC transporter substrate-binding protein [Chloroflexota bacterium]